MTSGRNVFFFMSINHDFPMYVYMKMINYKYPSNQNEMRCAIRKLGSFKLVENQYERHGHRENTANMLET